MDNIEWRKESFVQIWNGNTATVTIWQKRHDKFFKTFFLKNLVSLVCALFDDKVTGASGLCCVLHFGSNYSIPACIVSPSLTMKNV